MSGWLMRGRAATHTCNPAQCIDSCVGIVRKGEVIGTQPVVAEDDVRFAVHVKFEEPRPDRPGLGEEQPSSHSARS